MHSPRPFARALAVLLLAGLPLSSAHADEPAPLPLAKPQSTFSDRWSAGLFLGGPSGFTVKRHLGGGNAWDLGLGFVYSPGLRIHGDYLWTLGAFKADPKLSFRFQIGVGGFVGFLTGPCHSFYGSAWSGCDSRPYLGVRLPLLIEAWPTAAPLNFGLELAPAFGVGPGGAGGLLDAFLFVRFLLG